LLVVVGDIDVAVVVGVVLPAGSRERDVALDLYCHVLSQKYRPRHLTPVHTVCKPTIQNLCFQFHNLHTMTHLQVRNLGLGHLQLRPHFFKLCCFGIALFLWDVCVSGCAVGVSGGVSGGSMH
jgi:hypothetical protein